MESYYVTLLHELIGLPRSHLDRQAAQGRGELWVVRAGLAADHRDNAYGGMTPPALSIEEVNDG